MNDKKRQFTQSGYSRLYICSSCWNTLEISAQINFQLSGDYPIISQIISNSNFKLPSSNVGWDIPSINCPLCGNKMFWCDANLGDIVMRFNQLGFPTSYCCEGHAGNPGTLGYISFKPMAFKNKMILRSVCDLIRCKVERFGDITFNTEYRVTEETFLKKDKFLIRPGYSTVSDCNIEYPYAEIIICAHSENPSTIESEKLDIANKLFKEFLEMVLCQLDLAKDTMF